jgi:prepilin-type N-terminal cleavage/methylation domain-containing protein
MMVFRKTPRASSFRPRVGGFTLIELLAVIAILAVLVSLVVGVGRVLQSKAHHDQTVSTMNLLSAALTAYYDSYSEYPPDHDTATSGGFSFATLPSLSTDPNATYHAGDGITVLYMYLTGKHLQDDSHNTADGTDLSGQPCVVAVRSYLDKLPSSAVSAAPPAAFVDGFGTPMRYQLLGGKPLLTSAGPDATFGTSPTDSYTADNIRSDSR